MNLELRSFADSGNLSKERIVFKVLADFDVGEYVVLRSGVGTNGKLPTSGRKIAYWFPDQAVEVEDLVVLYTKKGIRSSKPSNDGGTIHFFYWGKEEPLWSDQQFGAVLAEVTNWAFLIPK